jgi:hypothetical protein
MTDVMPPKAQKKERGLPFPVELADQLPAQIENKGAESILGEAGLAGQLKKMLASACCRLSWITIWPTRKSAVRTIATEAARRRC